MSEDSPVFDDRDRAVLRLADRLSMGNQTGALDPELHRQLSRFFDDAQIFELGMVAGILTGMAKFIFVYDLVEKEAHCPIPSHRAVAVPCEPAALR
jgi:alkylhydroperoxidase family enzyme